MPNTNIFETKQFTTTQELFKLFDRQNPVLFTLNGTQCYLYSLELQEVDPDTENYTFDPDPEADDFEPYCIDVNQTQFVLKYVPASQLQKPQDIFADFDTTPLSTQILPFDSTLPLDILKLAKAR